MLLTYVVLVSVFSVTHRLHVLYDGNYDGSDYHERVQEVIAYVNSESSWSGATLTQLSSRERIHMEDVQYVFSWLYTLYILCVIVLIYSWTFGKVIPITYRATTYAAAAIFAFGLLAFFFFEDVFIAFHKIVFTNDYWLLPADSYIISLFSQQTFANIAISTFIISIVVLLLLRGYCHGRLLQQGKANPEP